MASGKEAEIVDAEIDRKAERTSFILAIGGAAHDLEVITSPTPIDAAAFPGWRIVKVSIGWLAVHLVA